MGISLESIKAALATLPDSRTPNQQDWEALATRWQAELNARIKAMEVLRDSLTACIGWRLFVHETLPHL